MYILPCWLHGNCIYLHLKHKQVEFQNILSLSDDLETIHTLFKKEKKLKLTKIHETNIVMFICFILYR